MPKNKGKGGKNRRRGKNENEGLKRELVFKEDGQEYAQVQSEVEAVRCSYDNVGNGSHRTVQWCNVQGGIFFWPRL